MQDERSNSRRAFRPLVRSEGLVGDKTRTSLRYPHSPTEGATSEPESSDEPAAGSFPAQPPTPLCSSKAGGWGERKGASSQFLLLLLSVVVVVVLSARLKRTEAAQFPRHGRDSNNSSEEHVSSFTDTSPARDARWLLRVAVSACSDRN